MQRHSVDGFVFYNMQHVISSPRRHGDLSIVRVFILFHRGPVPSSIQILLYTHFYGFSKIKQTRRKTALLDTDSQMCSMSSIRTRRSCQGHKSNRPLGTCYGARSAAAPASAVALPPPGAPPTFPPPAAPPATPLAAPVTAPVAAPPTAPVAVLVAAPPLRRAGPRRAPYCARRRRAPRGG